MRIITGNGGGFGDPSRRSRERILQDLRNGYVSVKEAVETYRVSPEVASAAAKS